LKANQQNNNHLQWETAFLLTLAIFPLIGIGPIIAISYSYSFKSRNWSRRLLISGIVVLGFQFLMICSFYLCGQLAVSYYDLISENNIIYMFLAFPIIGLIIGCIKKSKDRATWLIMDSASILLSYGFFSLYLTVTMNNTFDYFLLSYMEYSFIAFPIVFVLICVYRYRTMRIWGILLSGTALLLINICLLMTIFWFVKYNAYDYYNEEIFRCMLNIPYASAT